MSKQVKKQPLASNTSKLNSIISSTGYKKSNKSLLSIEPSLTSDLVQLSQSQVNFINTEQGQVYQISFLVRNISQKSIKVKLKKPKSDYFAATFEKDGLLAPGLEKKIIITYNSQLNQQIHDKLFLYCEDQFEIEVPVCVFPTVYNLEYQPFINLGFVKFGSIQQHRIKIGNKRNIPAQIRLQPQFKGAKAVIQPMILTIQPKTEEQAILYLSSDQATQFEGIIQIHPQILGEQVIEVVGSFCEHTRFISDANGKQISELVINPMLGGQKLTTVFNLVNNTPKSCEFRIIRKKGFSNKDDQNVLITPQQFGREDEQKNITFSSKQGQLQPYSKKQITCDIIAKIEEYDQQLFCNYLSGRIKLLPYQSKQWVYMISTTFKDEDSAKSLIIRGQSLIPKLSINSIFFKFGDCPLRTKQEKLLKIENFSDRPITVTIQKSQNYSCKPDTFQIPKDGFKDVTVRFFPKVVGDLNQICYIKAASFSFPLKMFGKGTFVCQSHKKGSLTKDIQYSIDHSRGVQINVSDMDKTLLEQQISIINQNTIFVEENSKISTTNFDCSSIGGGSMQKTKLQNKNSIRKKPLKNRNGKQVIVDIQNFNPDEQVEQYPVLGRSLQEDRVASRQLTLNQFKNIPVGPIVLDFGEIFVSSAQSKTFHICNLNSKSISIQIQTKNKAQFEKTSRQAQILPAESHGGLKIIYQAINQGAFKHSLQYIINGRHYFEILAIGTAILPTIQLSKNEFKFVAGEDDHTFEKKQIFTLNNTYPFEVQYNFVSEKETLFKVSPSKGKIQPKGKQLISIVHNFLGILEGGGKIEQTLKLKIKNGKALELKCLSIIPQCYVICKPNQCNFKQISVYKQHEMKFSIKNTCKNFTIFKIIPNKDIQDEVKVTTSKNILSPDQFAQVTVKLMSQVQKTIDSGLTIIVRGGKKIFISIKAIIIVPKIRIEGEQINFGSLPVGGNPTSKQVTLVNQSLIPAQIDLVLFNDTFLERCLSIKCESNQLRTVNPPKDIKQIKAKVFQVKVAKKCKTQITLEFSPEQVKDYKFALPFYLTSSSQPFPSLQKNAICRSLKNRLVVDRKQLDFGKTIIQQSFDNVSKNVVFTLHNPQEQQIQWWASEKNIQPFSLQVKKGKIEGNSSIKIKAFFYSQNPGVFQKQLHFFLNSSDFQPSRPYIKLPIRATANYPQIYFDRPYVILPNVKLGQESVNKFQILNGGYENLNLKHSISQEYSSIDLNIKYINGSNLGITKKSIPVQVSFKSQKPISFTVKIDFYDHHNRAFSIFVSGTSDNSLYFLPDSYWLPDPAHELVNSSNFLINFLNSLGFVEDILYDFPNCLSNNDYQNLNKLIQYFSTQNDKIEKYKLISTTTNLKKANTTQENYDLLYEILRSLKSQGAFLSQIRPQFLMSQTQYVELLKIKSQNTRIFSNYKLPSSQQLKQKRLTSWIILIYQIFRVYSRVNSKKKLPTGDFWSHLLQKQKTIINWLEQCYQTEANLQEIKSSNQLSDLGDGQMLSALVTKYTNIKILQSYGKVCNNPKERQKRCKKIIEIFSQIGITSGAKAQDLLRSKPVEMLVFLERLYLILPYYLQKGQTIVFSCAIGQSLTKSIQVKNPSKFPVTYVAKIQGSKAYVIENEQEFQIESRQKHQIQVKYISNIDIDKNNATLTLSGRTSSKFTPSTFIFLLKSVSLGRISEKNVQITGQLYEPYQFQINVKNNFLSDTSFNIEISCTNPKIQTKNLYCTAPFIKIKKDQTISVPFLFFPFVLQTHKYQILFRDPKVGQFQYDLTALVDMPQTMSEPIKLPQIFFTNKLYPIQIIISQKNEQILKARKQFQAFLQKIQRKAQSQLSSIGKKTSIGQVQKNFYPNLKEQSYSLSLVPHTQMVTLKNTTITLDPQQEQLSGLKKIHLEINMKMPVKDAPMFLIMKNSSNNDIRRYKILINSAYKPLRYELQMKVPVNQSLTQPLPLINISNETNIFNVSLTTNSNINLTQNRNVFSFVNQKDILIRAREQSTVNLTFSPKAQINYQGLVKIQNITVGQIVEYQINAIGEEPIPQMIKYEQKTSEHKKYAIKIPFTKPQKLTVVKCTFNPQNIKYEKSSWCSCQSLSVFKFEYYTRIPGIYDGKIYLQDQNKIHAFHITILVNQNIEGVIEIKAIQRERYQSSINLEKGHWSVECTDPNLIIQHQFEQAQSGPFSFGYIGSKAGSHESQLIVKSQKIGYFKYLLKITIQQQPQMQIKDLKCQLGKTFTTIIKLQNSENNPLTITGTCTNIETFYYLPQGNFIIPPKSKKQITLVYRPTCLELEIGKISFISNNNIKWKYQLSGCGSLQTDDEIKQIDGEVGTQIIETINFVNPFKKDVFVYMMLDNQKDNQVKFATKNQKQALRYLQQLQIPIKFILNQAKKYTCRLKILINQKIFWKYVINVRTICKSQDEVKIYKLPSRGKKQLTTSFVLPKLNKQIQKTEKFKCVLTAEDPNLQQLLKSTCRVMKDWESINDGKLSFLFNFLSFRPFVCPFFYEIYQQNNCKWIFKGEVEYTMPPPDDQFEIISEINKATSVMFRLNNRVKSHAKFKAYFTSDSDMQFSISPKSGDLQPYGRQGSQFEVTFAPTQYRNSWHGKIIIETDDSFWSYIVRGNLPHYIPPVGKSNLGASTITKRHQ